jgi:hypothetical protein
VAVYYGRISGPTTFVFEHSGGCSETSKKSTGAGALGKRWQVIEQGQDKRASVPSGCGSMPIGIISS